MNTSKLPSLRRQLTIVLIILGTLFSAGITTTLYDNFRKELRENLRHRLENITTLAGLQQDGDLLLQVQAANDAAFQQIQETNANIKRSEKELRFVYTMRKDENGIYFVVDARTSPDEADISEFGDRYLEPSDTLVNNFDTMNGTIIEPDIYTDEFGSFLSGYTPIFTEAGERVGVLGVDISAATITGQETVFRQKLILIFIGAFLILIIAAFILANYLSIPIIQLRNAAEKITNGNFSHRIQDIPRTRELAQLAVDFNEMTSKLSNLIEDLGLRVAERTSDIAKKSEQLRIAAFIARQTAEVYDLASLLEIVVRLVSDQFDFYHTGIYLINDAGDEAVLQAASSEEGLKMIEHGHSVAIGAAGAVGQALAVRRFRIVFDVNLDTSGLSKTDLPRTHSEVALPLIARNRVLGVLDIHSDQTQAFNADEIEILQTLADQIAVAIETVRILDESQSAVNQLETLTSERTRDAWRRELKRKSRAYTYTALGLRPEKLPLKENNAISAAITIRGHQIGRITVSRKKNVIWNPSDQDFILEIANQIGPAIDNIRLLEDANLRAQQEQTVGKIAARFGQSLDIDSLLKSAVKELGQLADVEEATVFISESNRNKNDNAKNGERGLAASSKL